MKKGILAIAMALFMMIGCQDNNSILEPNDKNIEASTLNKGRVILDRSLDDDDSDLRLLDDYSYETNYKVHYTENFTIDGKKGGKLSIRHQWKDEDGKNVWLEAELWIPRKAFEGTKTFDMIFDLENLSMELYPSPFTFNTPVEFSMGFYGLDLSEFANSNFDFNYLDGQEENIKYFSKYVDIAGGTLEIWDAELHHFSRYGWVRSR